MLILQLLSTITICWLVKMLRKTFNSNAPLITKTATGGTLTSTDLGLTIGVIDNGTIDTGLYVDGVEVTNDSAGADILTSLYGTYTNDYNGVYTSSNDLLLRNNKGKIADIEFSTTDKNKLVLETTDSDTYLQVSDFATTAELKITISSGRSEGVDWKFSTENATAVAWGNAKSNDGNITLSTVFKCS